MASLFEQYENAVANSSQPTTTGYNSNNYSNKNEVILVCQI